MDEAAGGLLGAKICLTVATFFFGAIPSIADLNKTHATNPLWTPHARLHVVWSSMSYLALGALSIYFIWFHEGDQKQALYLVMLFGLFVMGGFFIAYFTVKLYGGSSYDQNGYPPFTLNLFGSKITLDANFTAFSTGLAFVAAAFFLVG